MANVLFKRVNNTTLGTEAIQDGKLLWNTENTDIYLDNGTTRIKMASNTYLSANLTLYVATTGNDTTGTGTSVNPYATISKALSVVPKNLNGYDATIQLAGGTYTDNIFIDGLHGGRFILSVNGAVILNGYIVQVDCAVMAQIQTSSSGTLTINNTPNYANGAIYMTSSEMLQIVNVPLVINSTTQGIFANNPSNFYSGASVKINNTTNCAVQSAVGSFVSFVSTLSGTNNAVGLKANAAVISYNTNTLSATTPVQKLNGGIITNELANKNLTEVTLASGSWTLSSGAYYQTVTLTGATSSTVAYWSMKIAGNTSTSTEDINNSYINNVVYGTNTVTFWAKAIPSANMTIKIVGV